MITLHIEAENLSDLYAKVNAALTGATLTSTAALDNEADEDAGTARVIAATSAAIARGDDVAIPEKVWEGIEASKKEPKVTRKAKEEPKAAEPGTPKEEPQPSELGYEEDIKPAVLKLAGLEGKGREAVVSLLDDWKQKINPDAESFKASDVPAERYAEFLADIQSRMEG